MYRVQEWQLSLSYFPSYFPLFVLDVISCPPYNLKTLWDIIMILQLCSSRLDDVSGARMTTLTFILSVLFPLDGFRCNFPSAP